MQSFKFITAMSTHRISVLMIRDFDACGGVGVCVEFRKQCTMDNGTMDYVLGEI